jgi:transglutaminase-like putative cysteine protease
MPALKILLICLLLAPFVSAKEEPNSRRFTFTYVAIVKEIPKGSKVLNLWLPIAHADEFQEITNLRIDSPYKYSIKSSQYGNRVLHLQVPNPTRGFEITLTFDVLRREHLKPLQQGRTIPITVRRSPDIYMRRWLSPDRLVPLDPQIRTWAREVITAAGARTDLERARAIYNHIIATVKYDKSGEGWGRGDIYYACDARRGNCTDFHAIFIGYCRAVGIPARFAIGFPLPAKRGQGEIGGYHCWAEFYDQKIGWVPIDASEAAKDPSKREYFFGAHDENRVEFTLGRDLTLTPRQNGEPLNYFIYPYMEIDGKPHTVEKSFSFRDIS